MENIIPSEEIAMETCPTETQDAVVTVIPRVYVQEFYNKTAFDFDKRIERLSNPSPAKLQYLYHGHIICHCMLITRQLMDRNRHREVAIWYDGLMRGVLEGTIAINENVDDIMWTPLQVAVRRSDYQMMERLLGAGADANIRDDFGNTALHVAAEVGNVRAVEILLNSGTVDPRAVNDRGFNTLVLAVQSGCTQLVEMLLNQQQYNINELIDDQLIKRKVSLLQCAVECNHPTVVKLLLERQADPNLPDSFGNSSLHVGCRIGSSEIVQLLLRHGANLQQKNGSGLSALPLTVKNGHNHVFEVLMSYGADLNEQGVGGATPLHHAITCYNLDLISNILSRGARVDALNNFGQTALHCCIQKKNWRALRVLVEHGLNLNTKDPLGKTSLHMAIEACQTDACELLLSRGADVNARDNMQQTPLHFATKQDQADICELLLRHNAHVNARDSAQQTPLHLAVRFSHATLLDKMLEHHVDLDAQDMHGLTPLHLAILSENVKILYTDHRLIFFYKLLQSGARVRIKTAHTAETPLILAVKKRCPIFVRHLLDRGSDVEAMDNLAHKTPLQIAVEGEDAVSVELLLVHGAKVAKLRPIRPRISQHINQIIVRHFTKRLALGMTVDPDYSKTIDTKGKFAMRCKDELDQLRKTKIHNQQTYYDFLQGNRRSIVNLLANSELCSVFTENAQTNNSAARTSRLKTNFPLFADMLQRNYDVGMRYAPFLDDASHSLSSLLHLPAVPIERILDFLDDDDMRNVVQVQSYLTK